MRSKLFVPGSRPELFPKALAGQADALSFDLEDSVTEDRKAEARRAVRAALVSADFAASTKLMIVRVNARGTPHYEADLAAMVCPRLELINMPKVESADDILAVVEDLERLEMVSGLSRPTGILANIESPRGWRLAAEIACAHTRVVGLQLGFADLFEPLGIDRSNPEAVHQVQLAVRLAAGEAGIWACDSAYGAIKDVDGYRAEAVAAKRLGYLAKSCIHPSQVAIANEVFRPTDEEIAHAQRVVATAVAAAKTGTGAFMVDGKMIDLPFINRAKSIVAIARHLVPSAR